MNGLNSFKGKLGIVRAKHLLRRSTFAIDISTIKKFALLSADQAIELLFDFNPTYKTEPYDPITKQAYIDLYRGKPFKRRRNKGSKVGRLQKYTLGWWVNEAAQDFTIKSKLVFFLHTCFSIRYFQSEGILPNHFYDHIQLLTKYTKGSYKDLALEMVVDNTMLEFLDNYTNSKDNPNENFAREFLELFTIGKGEQVGEGNYSTYTEQDIITAAKLLTGFVKGPLKVNSKKKVSDVIIKTTPCRGAAKYFNHDVSTKVFSPAFDNTEIVGAKSRKDMWRELNEFVEMVFAKKATALNICRKIYRFFVYRKITPEVESNIIELLAAQLIKNNFKIETIIKTLLKSEHFLGNATSEDSSKYIGAVVKSPLDLALNVLTFFKIKTPDIQKKQMQFYEFWFTEGLLTKILIQSGMHPFAPQDVAGYPSYYQEPNFHRGWFSSSSIIGRYSFIHELIRAKEDEKDFGGANLDIVLFVKENIKIPKDAKKLVSQLVGYLFPLRPSQDRYEYFLNQVLLDDLSFKNWSKEWDNYIISNEDSSIRRPLERLVVALLNSPEYQVI